MIGLRDVLTGGGIHGIEYQVYFVQLMTSEKKHLAGFLVYEGNVGEM